MQVQSALLFETTEEIYARVFRQMRPAAPLPKLQVNFKPFANANSSIRLRDGRLEVSISDVLRSAPAPIQEALANILLGKLFRKTISAIHSHQYRRWLLRADVRRQIQTLRLERGRKYVSGPQGDAYHLDPIFDDLNLRFFHGLMPRPQLGWSRRPSRTLLGHYDPSHNAIVISRVLDRPEVPILAVEYVLYHEMLHLRYPVEHNGARRCIHTPEFKRAEKEFPDLKEAKRILRNLP
ncbi:MAG: M48 family peptidase [Bryobacteraceae bacterium]